MRRSSVALVVASTCAATSSLTATARAVEREHHLGADVGGTLLVISDKSTHDLGGTLAAHYAYGLTDAFNLMVEAGYSQLALGQTADSKNTPHTYPAWLANADVGIGYVFDVLQWVPYGGLLIGGYGLSGGTVPGLKLLPGAAIQLGLDYRIGPSLAVGVAFRQHMVTETSTYPSLTQVVARIETTWGW